MHKLKENNGELPACNLIRKGCVVHMGTVLFGCRYVAVYNLMSFSIMDFVKVKCDVDINPLKPSDHYIYIYRQV
jgi:hypothetical protein